MSIEARRHSPRVKLSQTEYINFGSGNRGVVRDISDGGLGFSSTSPIRSGREIRFRLSLSGDPGDKSREKNEVIADIAWNDDSGTKGGLRFKTVPEEVRPQLRAWMEKQTLFTGEKGGRESEAGVPAEWTDALEVTGLGPEVARSRESDERVAAAAVEILAVEGSSDLVADSFTSNTIEPAAVAQEEAEAAPALSFGSFSRTVPGAKEGELTMFPPEATQADRGTFSYRAQQSRKNLLGVAVIILLCAVGASVAAVWYVYPSQTRYEVQRAQERITRFMEPAAKQPISNVEPASSGGGSPHNGFAGIIPENEPTAPGTRDDGSDSASKPENSSNIPSGNTDLSSNENANNDSPNYLANGESPRTDSADNSPNPDAASTTEKSPPATNQSDTELALARTYLGSDSTPDQKAKAVQLLWLATEKGNIDAEIQLADLYASGEDVPRSCVQARILLKAAQVANPSAAEPKLKELDQTGCS